MATIEPKPVEQIKLLEVEDINLSSTVVNTNATVYITVKISAMNLWLKDKNDNYLIDSNNKYMFNGTNGYVDYKII